ncbi:hypothetical protein OPT61_g9357 [Boeremia exigua]|uniref:Uncharacterized protein n=1 Tax=Boeremia exigua TaxID=749465 RepID=A0ACC2HUG1_9PLEO|nr:hypothetical protein OPT61_g9357 [Boeremia exigua]
MASRPSNVGIKAIELYFPSQCVDQAELERFDGVSPGKYTIGLGQTKMSFCDDREDIYSLALTALSSLLKKHSVNPKNIGRLELFEESGNFNVEGVDTINACYGGTNALYNTIDWFESSSWDGRDAIVIAGDIALYKKGTARPTGGAGCVAFLLGPDAPIVFEPGLRGTYVKHEYDFYKPDLGSEYPVVDGHYSMRCYTQSVDNCYRAYNAREARLKSSSHSNGVNGHEEQTNSSYSNGVNGHQEQNVPLDRFDYLCFHAPTCKLVSKSYARLLYNDYLSDPENTLFAAVPAEIASLPYDASFSDKSVEKTFTALAKERYTQRVAPTLEVPTMCGNMYCASLYSSLCSLLMNVESEQLQGARIGMFSYGSGLASSFFSLRVAGSTKVMAEMLDTKNRLTARRTVDPAVYDEMCNLRERAHLNKNYTPAGDPNTLFPGTYYLTEIDNLFQRNSSVHLFNPKIFSGAILSFAVMLELSELTNDNSMKLIEVTAAAGRTTEGSSAGTGVTDPVSMKLINKSDPEVTLQEFHSITTGFSIMDSSAKPGYKKIESFCQQILRHNSPFRYAWVDTCCINKQDITTVDREINKMFEYYRDAEVCYVHLDDVTLPLTLEWFKRGWTLRELIAPKDVKLFDKEWREIGTLEILKDILSGITRIAPQIPGSVTNLRSASVAHRLSWAAKRETTESEDIAYCLLGIFGVTMKLEYGEGAKKAFMRSQEKILTKSGDQSLFAWQPTDFSPSTPVCQLRPIATLDDSRVEIV